MPEASAFRAGAAAPRRLFVFKIVALPFDDYDALDIFLLLRDTLDAAPALLSDERTGGRVGVVALGAGTVGLLGALVGPGVATGCPCRGPAPPRLAALPSGAAGIWRVLAGCAREGGRCVTVPAGARDQSPHGEARQGEEAVLEET